MTMNYRFFSIKTSTYVLYTIGGSHKRDFNVFFRFNTMIFNRYYCILTATHNSITKNERFSGCLLHLFKIIFRLSPIHAKCTPVKTPLFHLTSVREREQMNDSAIFEYMRCGENENITLHGRLGFQCNPIFL